jgi:hypothetical protein
MFDAPLCEDAICGPPTPEEWSPQPLQPDGWTIITPETTAWLSLT